MSDERGTYIQLFRKITRSAIYDMPPIYLKVWIWILTHIDYETGETTTTIGNIATSVGWRERRRDKTPSRTTIGKVLRWLELENSLKTEVVNRVNHRLIVVNWTIYQCAKDKSRTVDGHGGEQLQDTTERIAKNLEQEKTKVHMSDKDHNGTAEVAEIATHYGKLINSKSRLTDSAKKKIKTRLKSYTVPELKDAIGRFSVTEWWMEENSRRGLAWFFNSDDRIDQFLNLKPVLQEAVNKKPEMPEWAKPIVKPQQ